MILSFIFFSVCKENGFRCDQTRCIPPNWKCDGYMDCNDSLDERHCNECRDDQFYCSHGVCINRSNICDGKPDCPDGRDERQCCMCHYHRFCFLFDK